jgi:hypothetical protein
MSLFANADGRRTVDYFDGLQTPKERHAPTELYIPLLFWFNRNKG